MTIDPKISFWFGVWTSILLLVASGTINFDGALPAAYVPLITRWCSILGTINSAILTAASGYSSSKPGPLTSAAPPSITPTVVKVLLAAFALSFLLAGGSPAHARAKPHKHVALIMQAAKPRLTGDLAKDLGIAKPASATDGDTAADKAVGSFGQEVRKITKALVDKAIADVTAASEDAARHNDLIAKPCWDANLKLLQGLPSQWENPPADIGIALGIQIQRDLLNSITGNDVTSLKVACAALWGDQLQIVGKVGALLGIRIATGGLF